ncbi:imm11 family protein [Litchfieldia salsa]|uniref:Immunity MXAN-0049 protein domain-containing protein n=1 Tax=Litchfieldia salsa TaxID=930152 RepID=A0A1H0PW61_9BACI|nr:DUF1629 domain-containing protein [Litchfieldia salsa]SDP09274.1 hypothetical protein SAMN05216565_101491 [Litchfieldia salsa]
MKIWLLHKLYDDYETLSFLNEDDSQFFHDHFNGVPIKDIWIHNQVGIYKGGKKGDFPPGLLAPPVFSDKAVQELEDVLGDMVEVLPISKESEKYYAINVINVLDCIDGEKAEVKRFRSGLIMKYKKYAFKEECLEGQDIFKVVDHEEKKLIKTQVFVSDKFKDKVIESGLKGFDFIGVWDSESTSDITQQADKSEEKM